MWKGGNLLGADLPALRRRAFKQAVAGEGEAFPCPRAVANPKPKASRVGEIGWEFEAVPQG